MKRNKVRKRRQDQHNESPEYLPSFFLRYDTIERYVTIKVIMHLHADYPQYRDLYITCSISGAH